MSANGKNPPPVGRRIKAAMQLAGIPSFEELAARIDQRNYGSRTLRKYAADELADIRYVPRRPQLVAIAEACGLPVEFFTIDFNELGRAPRDLDRRVAELEEGRQQLLAEIAALVADQVAEAIETGALPTAAEDPATATPRATR